jgi:hypothetical protein
MKGKADSSRLTLVSQPQDYFRELVTGVFTSQHILTQPETEFYLVNLLHQFMSADRLQDQPLAILLKQAFEETCPTTQTALFRNIGDLSLYMAGFFQDSFNRKLVDVDYYIDIGGSAYQRVASSFQEALLKKVYKELADKFGVFVDVLAEISEKTSPKTEKDLLRLYELWMRTGSERAAKALHEAGILPNETIRKDWQ